MAVSPDLTERHDAKDATPNKLPYAARVGISFIEVDADGDDGELYGLLCTTLRADSRIEWITSPTQDKNAFERPSFASFDTDESGGNDTPDPATHVHAFHFQEPITFEVNVPRRVQPHFEDFDGIPASRYWAAWDGIALVVLWQLEDFQASGSPSHELSIDDVFNSVTPSGGLIVQKVLEDAAKSCGFTLTSTPCSPNCSYTFAHTSLSVETVGYDEEAMFEEDEDESFARVSLPVMEDSPTAAVDELYRKLALITRIFAEMRSEGRTAIAAGSSGRYDLRTLLNLNYERAKIGAQPFRKTFKARRNTRHWRSASRLLIARMWLTLATLDRARQSWSRLRYIYDATADGENIGVVFSNEYGHEVHGTSEVDVSEVRSALERITNSLDSRALILATCAGAVVGAVIGAIVGSLI
jgi:hypothetical protein